jgi:hypothetical protein
MTAPDRGDGECGTTLHLNARHAPEAKGRLLQCSKIHFMRIFWKSIVPFLSFNSGSGENLYLIVSSIISMPK